MKTLFLLRHAKSSWDDADLPDFERPLNERGRQAAPLIGDAMRTNGFRPHLILSSPARRAEQTAHLVKEAAGFGGEIQFEKRIYEASAARLLEIVGEQNDRLASLLLVGHNPGMENLLRALTGETEAMPTAALAVIDLETDEWSRSNSSAGRLRALFRPKEIKQ